jgi:hypothetical protein
MTQPKEIIMQLAAPGGRYPDGLVEHGYIYAEKGHVCLCDERGTRIGASKTLRPSENAEEVARRFLRNEVGRKRWSAFNRPLHYPRGYSSGSADPAATNARLSHPCRRN